MARTRRGGSNRHIPVEDLGSKPTRSGREVLRALDTPGTSAKAHASPPPRPSTSSADPRTAKGLLSSIFRDERGKPLDMTKLDRGRRSSGAAWRWVVVLGLLAGAAVAGALVLNHPNKFANAAVDVAFDLPASVSSGAAVTIRVTVTNREAVALKRTSLALQYPEGFTVQSVQPAASNDAKQAWDLGGLSPGASRTVSITGVLLGSIGDTATFVGTATYVPANFSSDFTHTQSATVTVGSSRLQLAVDGPNSVVAGKPFVFSVTVTNAAAEDIPKVVLTGEVPSAYTLTAADPKATDGTRWAFGTLAAGASQTVKFTGSLAGDPGASLQFTWRVSLLGQDGVETAQSETHQVLLLINPTATLTLGVNGSSVDGTMALGDTLNVRVAYTNASDLALNHATLAVSVEGRPVDWTTLKDTAKGKRSGSTVTWTETQIPALAQLKPGDSGEVKFSVGTRTQIPVQTSADRNLSIRISATLTPSGEGAVETVATPLTRTVLTKVTVGSEARYTAEDGTKVGEGPLPPEVGASTTYRVLWTLGSTTNDSTDTVVSASLPDGVEYVAKNVQVSSGRLTYDPVTRAVRWVLPKLPAGSGTLVANETAEFSVSIAPTAAQQGTSPQLVSAVALTGTDAFANVPVTATAPAVTTAATTDPSVAGKGTVVAATNTNG